MQFAKKQGMYEDAIPLLESELKFQNDAFYNFVTRDFAQIISKFYDKSLSNTRDDIRYQRNTSILIAIIGALFIIIIVCIYIFRIKHLREIERNNILTIQSLQNNLKDKIKEIDLIKLQSESKIKDEHLKTNIRIAEMQDLISEQFKTVDHLCTSYFEFRGHKNEKQAIYNKVLDLINDWGENESFISRLALIADKSKNRVFTRFKQAYPDLKKSDYDLFLYLSLGLSTQSISILQKVKIGTVYNRKASLKKRILSECVSDTDEFIACMK